MPAAVLPIDDQVAAFESAAASLDCEEILEVLHPVALVDREAGASKENCAAAVSAARAVEGFESSSSEEYGTAALVEGETAGREISLIWALDPDGEFKWISSGAREDQIGTEPAEGVDFAAPVDEFIAALRADDCNAAFAVVAPENRLSYGNDERVFCKKYEDTFTASPETFGARLQEDPDAAPVEMGTTAALGFFGVATSPSGYRTVIADIAQDGETTRVFDVVPGPED